MTSGAFRFRTVVGASVQLVRVEDKFPASTDRRLEGVTQAHHKGA